MTTQSSSPRNSRLSRFASLFRRADTEVAAWPSVLIRVLGRGGSSSRMMRRSSSNPADRSRARSNGVVPVNSSYSYTPSE